MASYLYPMSLSLRAAAGLLVVAVITACDPVEEIQGYFYAETPRDAYEHRLKTAGLGGSAAVRDWMAAGAGALARAPVVELPYEETGYLDPAEAGALGIRFRAQRGQHLTIDVALAPDSAALVFVDVFRAPADTLEAVQHVASADSARRSVAFEPRRTGEYVLRVQPELLRGGRYTIRIRTSAALAFPVAGRSSRDVGSVFGDPRDNGNRDHHGIDIFAARGTPVVATSDAYVRRVNETPRGGRVIWLHDEQRGISVYYAHLDSQLVAAGTRVRAGDTLGMVGNTGNARATPPHLHFGIYSRGEGPIDPLPFVYHPRRTLPALAVDTSVLGRWLRGVRDDVRLRASPDDDAPVIAELPRLTALRVVGASGSWYRVLLPDGTPGFVAASVAQTASSPVARNTAPRALALQELPHPRAVVVDSIAQGESVDVYGRFGAYLLVTADHGARGWMREEGQDR